MSTLSTLSLSVQPAPTLSATARDPREILITRIRDRIQHLYDIGAFRIDIADVKHFQSADECAANIAHMSLQELAYIHGMVMEKRIPRPETLGGSTAKH